MSRGSRARYAEESSYKDRYVVSVVNPRYQIVARYEEKFPHGVEVTDHYSRFLNIQDVNQDFVDVAFCVSASSSSI